MRIACLGRFLPCPGGLIDAFVTRVRHDGAARRCWRGTTKPLVDRALIETVGGTWILQAELGRTRLRTRIHGDAGDAAWRARSRHARPAPAPPGRR